MKSRKNLRSTSFILFIGICLISIGLAIFFSKRTEVIQVIFTPTPQVTLIPSDTFTKVTGVIDGDTIVTESGEKVRYIGINTSEIETSECFATEASEINSNLVLGKTVKLERDVSETDKYGRLLRYVYVGDELINDELVKEGAAKVMTIPPDTKMESTFITSEKFAKVNLLGLWGKCGK